MLSMKKNEQFEVTIDDIGINGEGIGHKDGQTIFVPYALVGERVYVHVINVKSKFAICKVLQVLSPSPDRVTPLCPYFGKCGGCDLQHLAYIKQLSFKRQSLINTLSKMFPLPTPVAEVVHGEQYYYRNKVSLPVGECKGELVIGLYRTNSHDIIPMTDCVIQQPFVAPLIDAVTEYAKANGVSGYSEQTEKGMLRHVVARKLNGQLLVTLVATTAKLPNINALVDILSKRFDKIGLNINVNTKRTNVIFGDKFVPVYGEQQLQGTSHGINYPISAYSFMQVNDDIRERIYQYVLDNISPSDCVVDAYSGAGLLTAMVSIKCKHAYGIEIVASAVDDANKLVKNNNISNVTNILGDCAEQLPKLMASISGDVSVILDPPRKGCDAKVVECLLQCLPKSITYISCNPATLARDLQKLIEGYDITAITPFDMFPNTKHLETVVTLVRRDK